MDQSQFNSRFAFIGLGIILAIIVILIIAGSCASQAQWSDEKCAATRLSALSGDEDAAFDLQDHCEG